MVLLGLPRGTKNYDQMKRKKKLPMMRRKRKIKLPMKMRVMTKMTMILKMHPWTICPNTSQHLWAILAAKLSQELVILIGIWLKSKNKKHK